MTLVARRELRGTGEWSRSVPLSRSTGWESCSVLQNVTCTTAQPAEACYGDVTPGGQRRQQLLKCTVIMGFSNI